jgi:hypothetical protein
MTYLYLWWHSNRYSNALLYSIPITRLSEYSLFRNEKRVGGHGSSGRALTYQVWRGPEFNPQYWEGMGVKQRNLIAKVCQNGCYSIILPMAIYPLIG